MPDKQLGAFLNSSPGFFVILGVLVVLLLLGRFLLRRVLDRRYMGQALVVLALVLVCAVFFVMSLWFPVKDEVGPAAIPRLWMLGILGCAAFIMVNILRRSEEPDPRGTDLVLRPKWPVWSWGISF